jgi:hypothetical protein
MPTYTNTGTEEIIVAQPRVVIIPPGEVIETEFYIPSLHVGLELTDDAPLVKPWELLATVTSYPSDDILTLGYPYITIYNGDTDISISANGDDDNALGVLSGKQTIIHNGSSIVGKLNIVVGDSTTYVWGSKIKIENLTQ